MLPKHSFRSINLDLINYLMSLATWIGLTPQAIHLIVPLVYRAKVKSICGHFDSFYMVRGQEIHVHIMFFHLFKFLCYGFDDQELCFSEKGCETQSNRP